MNDCLILPRRALPQPTPIVSTGGGDCGACVLGGLVGIPDVASVYDELLGGDRTPLTWNRVCAALWTALRNGRVDRIIEDVPLWPDRPCHLTFGAPSWAMSGAWFNYVRMAVDAGYYAIAEVAMRGGGPIVMTDHWLLIAGAREVPPPGGSGLIAQDVLISCSSRSRPDEEWIDAGTFLRERGGFNVILARPAIGQEPVHCCVVESARIVRTPGSGPKGQAQAIACTAHGTEVTQT